MHPMRLMLHSPSGAGDEHYMHLFLFLCGGGGTSTYSHSWFHRHSGLSFFAIRVDCLPASIRARSLSLLTGLYFPFLTDPLVSFTGFTLSLVGLGFGSARSSLGAGST